MKYTFTLEYPQLEQELKKLIAQECEKEELDLIHWQDKEPLFGKHSKIGLDSLDALQITVALQAHFGIRLQGDRMVRKYMMNIADLAQFIREQQQ